MRIRKFLTWRRESFAAAVNRRIYLIASLQVRGNHHSKAIIIPRPTISMNPRQLSTNLSLKSTPSFEDVSDEGGDIAPVSNFGYESVAELLEEFVL